jgi:hypothetical protein
VKFISASTSADAVSGASSFFLEQGESVQVDNLFKILVSLGLGDNIELLVPDQTKRPSYYLEKAESKPKRVRKKTEKNAEEEQIWKHGTMKL